MKEGRKPEYPEKTPGDELRKKMPPKSIRRAILFDARRFKPQARLEPAQQHWWQARKADMLTVTPRVPSFGVGLKGMCISSVSLEWRSRELNTW